MKIKTRESLRNIKVFDRASTLADKSKNGLSDMNSASEQTQGYGYESETEYAGERMNSTEESAAKSFVYGAERVGRWGVRETGKNIRRLRNRPKPDKSLKRLNAPKKAAKTAQNTQKALKAAGKTAKETAKASKRAAAAAKKAAQATVKAVKVAVKAIVAAVKAIIAGVKALVAAIAAGGWVAVLIIVLICVIALIAGSIFAIFLPGEDEPKMTLQTEMYALENEYNGRIGELQSAYTYDYCIYDGEKAPWRDIIALYAAKVNADPQKSDEVLSMTEKKAKILTDVFWTVNTLSAYSEQRTETETRYEIDSNGNTVRREVQVTRVCLHIQSETITTEEAAAKLGFNDKQNKALGELLDPYYDDMWAALGA